MGITTILMRTPTMILMQILTTNHIRLDQDTIIMVKVEAMAIIITTTMGLKIVVLASLECAVPAACYKCVFDDHHLLKHF